MTYAHRRAYLKISLSFKFRRYRHERQKMLVKWRRNQQDIRSINSWFKSWDKKDLTCFNLWLMSEVLTEEVRAAFALTSCPRKGVCYSAKQLLILNIKFNFAFGRGVLLKPTLNAVPFWRNVYGRPLNSNNAFASLFDKTSAVHRIKLSRCVLQRNRSVNPRKIFLILNQMLNIS